MVAPKVSGRLAALRSVPLFEHLPDKALRRIMKLAGELEAARGQVLVQPRTAGSGLFVVEEGQVVVETPKQRFELGPGEFFGELSLLTDRERSARVRALSDVKCLCISRADFSSMLHTEPELAVSMLQILAHRIIDRN